jgi:hypothetical protein
MSESTSSSLLSRVRHLELQLGLVDQNGGVQDVATRVGALEQQLQCNQYLGSMATEWKEMETLLEELSPGTALTHQKQIMAPILYRRQEVLASASTFQTDLERVAQIKTLLDIQSESSSSSSHNTIITEQQVVQAPILLVASDTIAKDELERLDRVSATVVQLQARIQHATSKLDRILEHYHALIAALSEKMVLMDEQQQLSIQQQ